MKTKDKVSKLDKNLRHKSGATANDFVATYCPMLRDHAFATQDDSINEMEKTLTHSIGMLIYYKRFAQILGLTTNGNFDPRDFVDAYENAVDAAAINRSRGMIEHLQNLINNAQPETNP